MGKVKFEELIPELCFAVNQETGETVLIKRGMSGYFSQKEIKHRNVDELNELFGVEKAQAEAMVYASMFGWEEAVANPKLYEGLKDNMFVHNDMSKRNKKDRITSN